MDNAIAVVFHNPSAEDSIPSSIRSTIAIGDSFY